MFDCFVARQKHNGIKPANENRRKNTLNINSLIIIYSRPGNSPFSKVSANVEIYIRLFADLGRLSLLSLSPNFYATGCIHAVLSWASRKGIQLRVIALSYLLNI